MKLCSLLKACSPQKSWYIFNRFSRNRWRQIQRAYQSAAQEAQGQTGALVVDMRSDTVTKPPQGMREAMASAEVGDDVMREDPTVNALQKRCATMFGKEAALFVPSGTMGNLISILVHCEGRGLEAILGHLSHIFYFEQGGISQFGGVLSSLIQNNPDGTFDVDTLRSKIRSGHNDPHQPLTRLVCLENTHNFCGGKVLPLSFLEEVYSIAKDKNIFVHLDGARIMNAATSSNIPVSSITQYTDTVNMCFSKGLGAPVGSIIAGPQKFIDRAVWLRKALGGGMRQAGVLAAAAMYSLDNVVPLLQNDHNHAQMLAKAVMDSDQDVVSIDVQGVHTNIIFMNIVKDGVTGMDLQNRLAQVTLEEKNEIGDSVTVKCLAWGEKLMRFVVHCNLSKTDMERATWKLVYVLKQLSS